MKEHTECVFCGMPVDYEIRLFKDGNHGEPCCNRPECCSERELDVISDDENSSERGER
ncbi:hypothetical protein [Alteribacter lacisalsi]|uniref:hypothetical protein n=1 Tax=Alteribacter lacisalsi TaxID=2045244 RepID=UPI001374A056|nr:hypothetical protein [Alteribacter lacisalsi]